MKECFAEANTGEKTSDVYKEYNYDPTDSGRRLWHWFAFTDDALVLVLALCRWSSLVVTL